MILDPWNRADASKKTQWIHGWAFKQMTGVDFVVCDPITRDYSWGWVFHFVPTVNLSLVNAPMSCASAFDRRSGWVREIGSGGVKQAAGYLAEWHVGHGTFEADDHELVYSGSDYEHYSRWFLEGAKAADEDFGHWYRSRCELGRSWPKLRAQDAVVRYYLEVFARGAGCGLRIAEDMTREYDWGWVFFFEPDGAPVPGLYPQRFGVVFDRVTGRRSLLSPHGIRFSLEELEEFRSPEIRQLLVAPPLEFTTGELNRYRCQSPRQ